MSEIRPAGTKRVGIIINAHNRGHNSILDAIAIMREERPQVPEIHRGAEVVEGGRILLGVEVYKAQVEHDHPLKGREVGGFFKACNGLQIL